VCWPRFVERPGGGALVDVDGDSLLDLGSGIAVVSVGNAAPQVVEAVAETSRAARADRAQPRGDVTFSGSILTSSRTWSVPPNHG
jgi:4-aminobutyrate aminotransferase-like enzyme